MVKGKMDDAAAERIRKARGESVWTIPPPRDPRAAVEEGGAHPKTCRMTLPSEQRSPPARTKTRLHQARPILILGGGRKENKAENRMEAAASDRRLLVRCHGHLVPSTELLRVASACSNMHRWHRVSRRGRGIPARLNSVSVDFAR